MAVERKLMMKLLIDNKSHKVRFTVATKEVVDFLFSLLGLLVGTIIMILTKDLMVGSVGSLYSSLERLDDTYILPNGSRTALLNPAVSSPSLAHSSLLLGPSIATNTYYICGSGQNKCANSVTEARGTLCPHCQ